jgi:hypothetical protein
LTFPINFSMVCNSEQTSSRAKVYLSAIPKKVR